MQVKFIQTYVLIILLLLEFFLSMTFFIFIFLQDIFCDCYTMAIPLFLGKIERHSCMQVLYR